MFHTFAIHPQHVFLHCHQATTVDCRWLCCTVRPWHRIETLKRRCNRTNIEEIPHGNWRFPGTPRESPSWSSSVKGAIHAIPSISKENIDPKPSENNPPVTGHFAVSCPAYLHEPLPWVTSPLRPQGLKGRCQALTFNCPTRASWGLKLFIWMQMFSYSCCKCSCMPLWAQGS